MLSNASVNYHDVPLKQACNPSQNDSEAIDTIYRELNELGNLSRKQNLSIDLQRIKITDKVDSIKETVERQERLSIQTHNLLEAYGIRTDNIDDITQKKLNFIVQKFKNEEENAKIKGEQAEFKQRFLIANQAFSSISALGSATGNKSLQVMGAVGTASVTIASEYAALAGLIPGMAPLVGIGMLFPIANIVVAGVSLFLALNKKNKGGSDATQQKLQRMMDLLATVRREMHARFDHVDEELIELKFLCKKVDERLIQLQNILKYEFNTVRADVVLTEEKAESRHKDLKSFIKELGEEAIFTTNSRLLFSPINFYLSGDKKARVPYRQLYDLEVSYFEELCKGLGSAKFSPDHTFSQVSQVLEHKTGYTLRYLAEFSQKKLGVSVSDTELPNIDLLEEEVKLALATRSKMKIKDKSSLDSTEERLSVLKQKTENMMQYVDSIFGDFKPLIKRIYDDFYRDGLNKFEAKAIEILTENNREELKADVPLPALHLTKITSTQAGCNDLDEKHFSHTLRHEKIALALHKAQRLNLGEWKLSYTGGRTQPDANLPSDIGRGWWRGQQVPTMPTYNVKLIFKPLIGEDINICGVSYKTNLASQSWDSHHRNSGALISNYINSQNSISLASLTSCHWASSGCSALNNEDYRSKVTEKFPPSLFATAAWNRVKTGSQWADVLVDPKLLTSSQMQFSAALEQLKAARELALAYARLIGAPIETLSKINNFFVVDLKTLIENPSLFRRDFNVEELLQECSTSSSSIKTRLQGLGDMLDLFTGVILKEEKEEKISFSQSSVGFFSKGKLQKPASEKAATIVAAYCDDPLLEPEVTPFFSRCT